MAADAAQDPPRDPEPASWSLRGVLVVLLKIGLVVVGLGVLAVGGLVILVVSNQPKAPAAVPAHVAWATHEVALSGDKPVARGRISLSATGIPAKRFQVGVNAGVPSVADASPGAALAGPVARLSASAGSGTVVSCFAPCELEVPESFDCDPGLCRMDIDVTVELLPSASGSTGAVSLSISGGVTGSVQTPLAAPFTIGVIFDDPVGPSGT